MLSRIEKPASIGLKLAGAFFVGLILSDLTGGKAETPSQEYAAMAVVELPPPAWTRPIPQMRQTAQVSDVLPQMPAVVKAPQRPEGMVLAPAS